MRRMLLAIPFSLVLAAVPAPASAAEAVGERGPGVGSEAPGFTLEALDGREVSLAALTGDGPVVLVFVRGAW